MAWGRAMCVCVIFAFLSPRPLNAHWEKGLGAHDVQPPEWHLGCQAPWAKSLLSAE